MVRRPESCWYEFRPVAALRQLSLRDPRSVEMATTSTEYNAKRGLFAPAPPIPSRKRWLIGSRERTVDLVHNSQAGPKLFAEQVLP